MCYEGHTTTLYPIIREYMRSDHDSCVCIFIQLVMYVYIQQSSVIHFFQHTIIIRIKENIL